MNFLLQAFCETNGPASSMRLLTAVVVIAIMAGWLDVTFHTHVIAPLPLDGAGGILLGALGVKAWQRGKETKVATAAPTPPNQPNP